MKDANLPVHPSEPERTIRKQGEVRDIITRLLGDASEPMRARQIHRAVESELGQDVSWSSIANCLQRNTGGPEALYERVGYGRYRRA